MSGEGGQTRQSSFDAQHLAIVAEIDSRGLAGDLGYKDTADLLRSAQRMSARAASARLEAARAVVPQRTILGEGLAVELPETAVAVACAEISLEHVVPIVLGAKGQPLDVGRRSRLVTPAMRRALDQRDGGCAHPGCDVPGQWTSAHHVTHWSQGGDTAVGDLVLLCLRHHHLIHKGEWTITVIGSIHRGGPEGRPRGTWFTGLNCSAGCPRRRNAQLCPQPSCRSRPTARRPSRHSVRIAPFDRQPPAAGSRPPLREFFCRRSDRAEMEFPSMDRDGCGCRGDGRGRGIADDGGHGQCRAYPPGRPRHRLLRLLHAGRGDAQLLLQPDQRDAAGYCAGAAKPDDLGVAIQPAEHAAHHGAPAALVVGSAAARLVGPTGRESACLESACLEATCG
ncbi:hypothetical protein GCM10009836_46210 [Pseudonocardia ailaonensis]|uniref:HNH nuclease domain-containing protein n=1 Tax=Pseudonocardia ailaonensis TaxID=367279 RepID=A0ABN2NAY8_9PSEU